MSQPTIFISYSQHDEPEKDQLVSQLGVLKHAGLIEIWNDDNIAVGADKAQEISRAIEQARAAILLISANFLTSGVLKKDIPRFLERCQDGELVILPIIAKPCPWRRVPWLENLQVRPKNGRPVWRANGGFAEEELAMIAEEIADIFEVEAQPHIKPFPPLTHYTSLREFRQWVQGN